MDENLLITELYEEIKDPIKKNLKNTDGTFFIGLKIIGLVIAVIGILILIFWGIYLFFGLKGIVWFVFGLIIIWGVLEGITFLGRRHRNIIK